MQSFNAVNPLRVLGRWMRMLTIPNQPSVAKLVKFALLTRDATAYLVERYSDRKESAKGLSKRVQ